MGFLVSSGCERAKKPPSGLFNLNPGRGNFSGGWSGSPRRAAGWVPGGKLSHCFRPFFIPGPPSFKGLGGVVGDPAKIYQWAGRGCCVGN